MAIRQGKIAAPQSKTQETGETGSGKTGGLGYSLDEVKPIANE